MARLRLTQKEKNAVDAFHRRFLTARKDQKDRIVLLSLDELEDMMTPAQRLVARKFLEVDPRDYGKRTPFYQMEDPPKGMVAVAGQKSRSRTTGKEATLITQYLPKDAHRAYLRLNAAMRRDLGNGVLMFASYRSPAYQLALVMRYYALNGHRMQRVLQWSALPGYTEHGDASRPAVDFTSEGGFFDEPFAETPAYAWLKENGKRYGFFESYQKNNKQGIGWEPWHWRYTG